MSEKVLEIEDLLGDDEESIEENLEGLYDLVIPPGAPVTRIHELISVLDLKPHTTVLTTSVEEDVDIDMTLVVLRGDLETVQRAQKYIVDVFDATVTCCED